MSRSVRDHGKKTPESSLKDVSLRKKPLEDVSARKGKKALKKISMNWSSDLPEIKTSKRDAPSKGSEQDHGEVFEDEKEEENKSTELVMSSKTTSQKKENHMSRKERIALIQPRSKPLGMDEPVWKIVQHTTVQAFSTRYYGYVLVHPGSVSYSNGSDVFRHVVYDPETLKKEHSFGYNIDGGGLPAPVWFGNYELEENLRDQCLDEMIKWGRLWRDRAENDLVETTEIAFSRADGPVGMKTKQGVVSGVLAGWAAGIAGVQSGWKILKIGSICVDPSTVVSELQNVLKVEDYPEDEDEDDDVYTISFRTKTPWSQELKASFMKKFLLPEFWRESILSACTLTRSIFTGNLVKQEIEAYVSNVKEMAFDTGSEIALDFLSRLCFTACDSLMSRTILSNLDNDLHGELLVDLASMVKNHFLDMTNSGDTGVPAIWSLFSRLFNLYPSTKRKFYPGRALNVWFRGVSLGFLQSIQSKIDPSWTTEDVKNKYVLPQTLDTETKLMADLAQPDQRGPASIFISHAWRNRYYDLVEACKNHPSELFFNDIIAIQQHSMKSDEMILDLQALPAIISYSSCCLLISDMKMKPLRRIWCLFELYHCLVTTESKLIVEFTSEGLADESDTGLWDSAKQIEECIRNIDVSKANATVEADKERILAEIQNNVPGGIEIFNFKLIAALKKEWAKNIREQWGWRMMATVVRAVRKVDTLEKQLDTVEKEVASLKGTLASVLARVEELEISTN